jgi:hypothetical protein
MQINRYLFGDDNDNQMMHWIKISITTNSSSRTISWSGNHASHCRRVGWSEFAFRPGLRLHACAFGVAAAIVRVCIV